MSALSFHYFTILLIYYFSPHSTAVANVWGWQPEMQKVYQVLPRTSTYYVLPRTTMYYHVLYHVLPRTTMYYHVLLPRTTQP